FLLGIVAVGATATDTKPVALAQLTAWLTAGVPSSRLARLAQERGIASAASKEELRQLESAGADKHLIQAVSTAKATSSAGVAKPVPSPLLKAAVAAHEQRYHDAERQLREALNSDPQNASLHFALGAMLRQQEHFEEAFDEITEAARLMPD